MLAMPAGSASYWRFEQLLLPKISDAAAAEVLDENLGQLLDMLGARPIALPLASERQRGRVVDHSLRIVAVQVRELVRLVVDQNEYRVFRTKKRIKAVTKGHQDFLSLPPWTAMGSRETCASGRRCLDAICRSFW